MIGRKRVTNKLPLHIIITDKGSNSLGISKIPLTLTGDFKYYLFKENSGLVRMGITIDFYHQYSHLFDKCDKNGVKMSTYGLNGVTTSKI